MPTSMLFGVNNEGRVFGLSTNGTKWREFPFPGIEFKHLSAVPHYLWAIGSDRQVYLHVHGLDTAIRIKEESYENQRWLPMEGFSTRLLPTDRYVFSSEDGLTERRKDKIRVPSMAWKWESDWKIETILDNEPLDHDGWTYAVDFPATYCATKKWSSCVRRRKWVRYRKYIAMNSWCAIAPLHSDPTQEPFRDVSVGGQNMTGCAPGAIQVWAVTIHGRVMWRKGVSILCPEGTKWNEIPLTSGIEIRRIWAGPGDRVWAVTSTGSVLVRMGITPAQPTGESWLEVEQPLGDVKLAQICVGTHAIWALGEDSTLWFRKGTIANPLGSGWVHMVGYMANITISPNDQVVGVGAKDRNLFIRVGMGEGELAGKKWKLIETPVQDSRASSISSLSQRTQASMDDFIISGQDFETSRSAPTSLNLQPAWQRSSHPSSLPANQGFIEEPAICNQNTIKEETDTRKKLTAWSPVRSVGSVLGLEANADTNPLAEDVESEVFKERESVCEPDWKQVITIWSNVEAGALEADPNHLPNWFSDSGYSSGLELSPWRCKILENLQTTNKSCKVGFEKIELAVSKASSLKSGECRYCLSGGESFEDCVLELEWVSNQNSRVESGSLIILSIEKKFTKYQVSLEEIVWVGSCSEPGLPRLAVHTSTSQQHLILQFSCDTDLDEWNAQFTSVVCGFQNSEGKPDPLSIWATTNLGDVFVFDSASMQFPLEAGDYTSYSGVNLAHTHNDVPWRDVLKKGFSFDSSLTIVCSVKKDCSRLSVELQCDFDSLIALQLNIRFDENVVISNTMINKIWGDEKRRGELKLRNQNMINIEIFCLQNSFQVLINDLLLPYKHRINPDLINHLSISGDVILKNIIYKPNIHKVINGCNNPNIENLCYYNKGVPWGSPLKDGFAYNSSLTVVVNVQKNHDRLIVELMCDSFGTVALRINPNFDECIVFRNTMINNKWGDDEKEGEFNFQNHTTVTIDILCLQDCFQISMNGIMFYYNHRIKPNLINNISISGSIVLENVIYKPEKYESSLEVDVCNDSKVEDLAYYQKALPWLYTLKEHFTPNSSLVIVIYILEDSDRFNILLQRHSELIAFSLNSKLDENIVERNSYMDSCWGDLEDEGEFLFNCETTVTYIIDFLPQCFQISINGKLFTFKYRMNPELINQIHIFGNVILEHVMYKPALHNEAWHTSNDSTGINLLHSFKFYDQPYLCVLNKGFSLNSSLSIVVYTLKNCQRFCVDLMCDINKTVALRFELNFNPCSVWRNTLINQTWGEEEVAGEFKIKTQSTVSIDILCLPFGFQILINGVLFSYQHRINPDLINHVNIHGDIIVEKVIYNPSSKEKIDACCKSSESLACYDKRVPWKRVLRNGFRINSCLTVVVHSLEDCLRFAVDLECEGGVKAFHFNPRYDDGVVVRNAFINCNWGYSESVGEFSLKNNTRVNIKIECQQESFQILMNDQLFNFKHRIDPGLISYVHIYGYGEFLLEKVIYKPSINEDALATCDDLNSKNLARKYKGIPWVCFLNEGFPVNSCITVVMFVPESAERFSVNLGNDKFWKALYFQTLFNKRVVEISSRLYSWDDTVTHNNLTLQPNSVVTINIECCPEGFQILMNGTKYLYGHRQNPNLISHVELTGDIFVETVFYNPYVATNLFQAINGSNGLNLSYHHSQVPWRSVLCKGFTLDSSLIIDCCIPIDCLRFTIDLECEIDGKIAFRFNPRFDKNIILRNSFIKGKWGDDEWQGDFTLEKQTDITIRILCQSDGFKILICDSEFTSYSHRIKPEFINFVSIKGDIRLKNVFYKPSESQQLDNNAYTRDLTSKHKAVPWRNVLSNGFPLNSYLTVVCSIPRSCERFSVNLEAEDGIAFHFNPRFDEKAIIRNTLKNGVWGDEEREGAFTLETQTTVTINILCHKDGFKIWLNGNVFTHYEHRMKPELINYAAVNGDVHLQKVTYRSNRPICNESAFWRQMGGHMAKVESCSSGVTWGISADNTPWVYTGGWGGSFLSGYEKSDVGVLPMKDMYCLHVYENQRWNPLTGFTCKGLPTDRPMWSDSTGHVKRSRDSIRLLNRHWQWVSDWAVDFTTPGGVDTEGWQYATDFPASYHSRKTITDYVRRRRWSRKCKLTIMGPWQEIGNTKIISVSLQQSSAMDNICVWAVGIGGDALFRKGVSSLNPMGENWEQVPCDQPLECMSCGYGNQVWAVSRKGYAMFRFGITTSNPIGMSWEMVESPKGATLKKVSVAKWSVWALDSQGNVFVRHEVSPVFPEGSYWESVEFTEKFEDISAGGDEVWAVSTKGMLYHRVAISKTFPVGLSWDPVVNANWKTVSCRGYIMKS